MLSTIAGWIESIVNGIMSILELVSSLGSMLMYFLEGIVNVIGSILQIPVNANSLVGVLPDVVGSSALALLAFFVSLAVLKLIKP